MLVAAERRWFAVDPNGTEHNLVLRVHVPAESPSGDWSATVSFGDLEKREYPIVGIDAWQAVHLGMRFVAARIQHLEESGWHFYWSRGGDPASSSQLEGST